MSVTHRADLAFQGISTRYSTHAMHPYVAAMVPALAARMIDETSPQRLLDPFCGGGVYASRAFERESQLRAWTSTFCRRS